MAQRKPLKVKVTLVVTVDRDEFELNYGPMSREDTGNDVRIAILDQVRTDPTVSGIIDVELKA
jgi:hypothetical protein